MTASPFSMDAYMIFFTENYFITTARDPEKFRPTFNSVLLKYPCRQGNSRCRQPSRMARTETKHDIDTLNGPFADLSFLDSSLRSE
jgi:hypothetical protein